MAFVTCSAEVWGAETSMLIILDGLVRHGVGATVYGPPGGDLERHVAARGHAFVALSLPPHGDVRANGLRRIPAVVREAIAGVRSTRRLVRIVGSHDVTVSFAQQVHLDVSIAGRIARRPTILDLHDIPRSPLSQRMVRLATRLSRRAVAISDVVAESAMPGTVEVVRRPIRAGVSSEAVRRDVGRFVVGMFGQIVEEKGILDVAAAVGELARRGVDVELLLVGGPRRDLDPDGAVAERLVGRARTLAGGRIVVHDRVDDPSALMAGCSVVVNFSVAEPLGRSLIEAQLLGVPVVCAPTGGAPEVVQHDRTGLVAAERSRMALVDSLGALASNPEAATAMGDAARRWARDAFGEEAIVARYAALVRRVARPAVAAPSASRPPRLAPRLMRAVILRFSVWSRRRRATAIASFCDAHRCRTAILVGVSSRSNTNEGIIEEMLSQRVTIVGSCDLHERSPFHAYVRADGRALPFRTSAVDICISNAVVEHVGDADDQREFVGEHARVARCLAIATPNRWFPIESHTGAVFRHWSPKWRQSRNEFSRLLSRGEFGALLPHYVRIRGSRWAPTFLGLGCQAPDRVEP